MSKLRIPGVLFAASCIATSAITPAAILAQDAGTGVPTLTLDEARQRARRVSPDAVAARGQVETASWERRSALANLFTPHITANGNYTRFSDPFFNFGTGGISPNATSATIEARYTLLGAGKLGNLKSSRASVASAAATETAAQFRTALEADRAYFAVLADRELARVAADRLRRAEEQFGVARVRVLAGEAIASDSLQLLLEVNRARVGVLSSDSALTASRLTLGRVAGLSGPAEASPIDSARLPELPMTLDEAAAEMRLRGPEITAARAAERRADAVVMAERELYLPEVSVGATVGNYDSELFPDALNRSQLAVTVSLPIWNAGQRELTVARARAERNVARAERQDQERAAGERVAQAYHGYGTARAGIELAQIGVTVSTENYRVQRARYREGATTILDLLEAQVSLTESEAELVQARYRTRLALSQLEALLGRRIFE
ncbi:MAG TPA: TolC family protein [Gemmatimonadaceae bacterium]|nr:TolC family protein [Gemmatimonadaceae bacterium]